MYQMKKIFGYAAVVAALVICLGAGGAWAKDAIKATVTANGFTFTESGNPVSRGTYAIGTLKIFMIVSALQWPATLSPFQLYLAVDEGKPTPATKYTVPIRLRQAGGDLVLSPNPSLFSVSGLAWEDSSMIGIAVPQAIRDDPSFNEDGVELVANLQIEPTMPGMHLDTVTTVKVFAKLVHPTASCLRTVSFLSDNGLNTNLSEGGQGITIPYRIQSGTFRLGNIDPSQMLFNTLVVNSCLEAKTFDLALGIGSNFSVPSTGQRVKLFVSANAASTEGELIDTFAELTAAYPDDFGGATNLGITPCAQSITLGGMFSMYMRADVTFDTSAFISCATLPAIGTEYTGFTADVLASDSNPATCGNGSTHPDSDGQATTSVKIKDISCSPSGNNTCCP